MKIWLPYLQTQTGADYSTRYLAQGLSERGHAVYAQSFSRHFEFSPWLLRLVAPPVGCNAIITNTWNGFAFARHGVPMVAVDRLFVLDPALDPYKTPQQRLYHRLLIQSFIKRTAQKADQVVAVSEYTADSFATQMALPRPKVILNAVDTDFFSPPTTARHIKQNEPRRLLFVGNLSKRKGADLLTPIMNQLGAGYQLYYTGSAAATVLGRNQPPNMHALGRLDQDQIREQYRRAHLLIFPSRGEGLARAIMEAMACGTPVVATAISSMPEAIDSHVGRLCPADDARAFAEAVIALTKQNSLWQSQSVGARQRAKNRFCLKRMVAEYEDLLIQLGAS